MARRHRLRAEDLKSGDGIARPATTGRGPGNRKGKKLSRGNWKDTALHTPPCQDTMHASTGPIQMCASPDFYGSLVHAWLLTTHARDHPHHQQRLLLPQAR